MARDQHSLMATEEGQRRTSPWGTLFIWLAATMTASTIPLGGIMGQLFPQAPFLLVILAASVMFVMVGIISIPGFLYGIPTMVMSEHMFGVRVNRWISASNWLSQVGWESVVLVIVIYIVRSLLFSGQTTYSVGDTMTALVVSLMANFTIPLIGYRAIVAAQKMGAAILMVFSVVILFHIPLKGSLVQGGLSLSGATWPEAMGALSIGLMGGALSWTMFGSDYSRFVRRDFSVGSVVMAPAVGGFVGTFLILFTSIALYQSGGVTFGRDGIAFPVGTFHNAFLYYGFCLFAVVGLLASNFLNAYSSAFSLAVAVQRDLNRKFSTLVDASIGTGVAIWILFFAPAFLDVFQVFLSLIIVVAAPWSGVVAVNVIADRLNKRGSANLSDWGRQRRGNGLVLLVSVLVSAAFSSNPLWEGYGARMLGGIDISPVAGLVVAALLMAVVRIGARPRAGAGRALDLGRADAGERG